MPLHSSFIHPRAFRLDPETADHLAIAALIHEDPGVVRRITQGLAELPVRDGVDTV